MNRLEAIAGLALELVQAELPEWPALQKLIHVL